MAESLVVFDRDLLRARRRRAAALGPATFLIDRQGRIAAEYPGLVDKDDIERNIRTLLRE